MEIVRNLGQGVKNVEILNGNNLLYVGERWHEWDILTSTIFLHILKCMNFYFNN